MAPEKSILLKKILSKATLILLPLFLVSCGSFSFPEKPVEQTKFGQTDNQNNNLAIHALESEVSELKQTIKDLNVQLVLKNKTIKMHEKETMSLENKITNFEKKSRVSKQFSQKIKYKDPAGLYKKARNLLFEEEYTTAAAHFSTFINDHPKHSLADNAVYWLGECHYSQGNFQQAIFVFKNLVKKFPKSEKVPDALLKTAYSYLFLDDSNRAHHYLKQVLKKYPFSPSSEKAQKKLEEFD